MSKPRRKPFPLIFARKAARVAAERAVISWLAQPTSFCSKRAGVPSCLIRWSTAGASQPIIRTDGGSRTACLRDFDVVDGDLRFARRCNDQVLLLGVLQGQTPGG